MVNTQEDDDNVAMEPISDDMKVYLLHMALSVHAGIVEKYYNSMVHLRDAVKMLVGDTADRVEVHDEYIKIVFSDGVPVGVLELLESFSIVISDDNIRVAIPSRIRTCKRVLK